jgi:acetyl esterase/lipase
MFLSLAVSDGDMSLKNALSRLHSALLLACLVTCGLGTAPANAQPKVNNVPWTNPTYTYTVQSNIVYGQGVINGGGTFKDLKLDLYIPDIPAPPVGSNKMPLMLMIHGGGFTTGTKTDDYIVTPAVEYASRGWLVASIDYRLLFEHPIPSSRVQALYDFVGGASATPRDRTAVAAIDDTLTALDFLQLRPDVNKNWTTVMGFSAGANTALGTSYALDDHAISRPPIKVVIEVSGFFDGKAVGNPFDGVPTSDPILMSIAGTLDPRYPYQLEVADWADDAGLPFYFEVFEGVDHVPDLFTNIASTGVILYQRTVDLHHETIFAGLEQGPQPPPGC